MLSNKMIQETLISSCLIIILGIFILPLFYTVVSFYEFIIKNYMLNLRLFVLLGLMPLCFYCLSNGLVISFIFHKLKDVGTGRRILAGCLISGIMSSIFVIFLLLRNDVYDGYLGLRKPIFYAVPLYWTVIVTGTFLGTIQAYIHHRFLPIAVSYPKKSERPLDDIESAVGNSKPIVPDKKFYETISQS